MRRSIFTLAVIACVWSVPPAVHGDDTSTDRKSDAAPGPKLETLLQAVLEGVDGTEVVVSRVTIPPHTSLPKHWHPGEEFAYVLSGKVTLWQKGRAEIECGPGQIVKVPLKQVHTAITKDVGATILVFRVHELGRPERIPAEDD